MLLSGWTAWAQTGTLQDRSKRLLTDIASSSLICFSGNYADPANKSGLFPGDNAALTRRPTMPMPMSDLVNLARAQANQGGGAPNTASSYTIQYRATSVNTASGTNQTLTHNFGPNTGIDRIVAYEMNTRVSVDMPFDSGSITDTQVTIQPLATTTYTAIIVIGHKLQ